MSSSAIRAGAAYIELTLRDKVSRPLHAASIALKDFGNAVSWQGAKIAAMGAAITAPLAAIAHSFATAAMEGSQLVNARDAANVMNYVGALTGLQDAFFKLRAAIGSAILPLMTKWPETLSRIVTRAAEWVKSNRVLVQTIAKVGSAIALAGTAIVFAGRGIATLGTLFGGLSTVASAAASAVGMLGPILAAMLTPLGLIVTGVAAFGAYMLVSSGLAGEALGWLKGKFAELHTDAVAAWQGIGDALATGDIKLAGEILWLSLKMEWQKGVNFINQIWITAKQAFVKAWTDATYSVAMLLTDPWYAMETAFNETLSFMQQGWLSFTGFLQQKLNWGVGEMEKLWVKFRKWMGADIDVEAHVKQIDETTKKAGETLDAETADKKAKTEERRRARKAEIDAARTPEGDALAADWKAAEDANTAEFDRQRQESMAALDKAKREAKDATQRAKDQKEKFVQPPPEPEGLMTNLGQEQAKLDSKGTFSAFAVRGLGSDSLAERTARGVERGADFLKNIEQHVRQAAGVFA